jgi:hypothetical protein
MPCDKAGDCEAEALLGWLLLFPPPNVEQAGSAAILERANSAATLRNLIMAFSLASRRDQAPRLRRRGTRHQSTTTIEISITRSEAATVESESTQIKGGIVGVTSAPAHRHLPCPIR